ncbi:uncharacterized protein K02A2.6-like [Schistocerca serialis cubense]|uniref:uncharacterized protein K02A2.6-like n=1 Tax=Schistocerca serialis cubense TaxID=2023355 RepID=UPI00214E9E86|nr:uncharacterized protein K02A2.6-like [Schistocerca serialis cubense]
MGHRCASWQRIYNDYARPFLRSCWLVLVNAYTEFPIAVPMQLTTSSATARIVAQVLAVEGLPTTVISDNGQQFMLKEFSYFYNGQQFMLKEFLDFCNHNSIFHVCTTHFHPQSNSEAERFIHMFNQRKLKVKECHTKEDALLIFLGFYHYIPIRQHSAAELLHGWKQWTLLISCTICLAKSTW